MLAVRNQEKTYSDKAISAIRGLSIVFNKDKSWEDGYFIIDTTGEYQVYFTLYVCRFIKRRLANGREDTITTYKYLKNLTTDLEKLAEVFKKLQYSNLPVIVASTDNNDPKVCAYRNRLKEQVPLIKFGKYEGMTIGEIWDIDRNWVMWFSKNYKQGTYTDWRGNQRPAKKDENDLALLDTAKVLIDTFFEEMTEKNRETCTSKHIGVLKQRMTITATVKTIKTYADSKVINLATSEGDLLYIYDKGFNLTEGQEITLKGTPTKHTEKLGRKTTYFNRVDIQS